jgi:hypothetical protein
MTSAVRHPGQMWDSQTQSQRSAFASCNRRGRVRCSTCSWCRNASTSSWSAAYDRTDPRRVKRSDRSAEIIAEKRIVPTKNSISSNPRQRPERRERFG